MQPPRATSKHIKAAQFAWHGSCRALDEALESEAPREQMAQVLMRNMYVDDEGDPLVDEAGEPLEHVVAGASWLADYLLAQRSHLLTLATADVLKGRITWAEPPPPPAAVANV